MWSSLPVAGSWLSEAELEAKLRALDPSPDLSIEHRYQKIERTDRGPIEFHEAACLFTPVDSMPIFRAPGGNGPIHPCVDARTGEDIDSTGREKQGDALNRDSTSPDEDEEMARVGIVTKCAFDDGAQSIDTVAHPDELGGEVDLDVRRKSEPQGVREARAAEAVIRLSGRCPIVLHFRQQR